MIGINNRDLDEQRVDIQTTFELMPDVPAGKTVVAESGISGREELMELYRTAWAHAEESVRTLGLDAPATVPWWPEDRRETTLGYVTVHMLAEVAHHAGHADVVRESIDGFAGGDHDDLGDAAWWQAHLERVQAAADAHRA